MSPYVPKGDPSCFNVVSWNHQCGQVSTDNYLDCLLDHLLGARHPEDVIKYTVDDALSTAIQSCMFEPNFMPLDDMLDTNYLKSLLMNCWNGTLASAKQQAPGVLASLKPNGISDNILAAMICIACVHRHIDLLDYCISLSNDPAELMEKMEDAVWIAAVREPDQRVWAKLLDSGWLSRPAKSDLRSFSQLAKRALLRDVPNIELMEVLFNHGYVLSKIAFEYAAMRDPDTVRYLLSKVDASIMNNSNALQIAAQHDPRVVEILLDSGMDINQMSKNDGWVNPRDPHENLSHTALHCAAEEGNVETVKLLLQRGAKRDIEDSWRRTPAKVALRAQHPEIAELIQNFVP